MTVITSSPTSMLSLLTPTLRNCIPTCVTSWQNTLLLVDSLQRCGKQFDLMLYPDGMHGYRGEQSLHDNEADREFWTRYLLNP